MDPLPVRPASRAAFGFVFVTAALDILALGVMVPVLPELVKQFEGGDVAKAAQMIGWFGIVWAAMQFVASPVLGSLSDRFGRRPVILLSNLGLGLDYLLMAWAPTLPWLFIGRVVSGITSASFPTAAAYIADVTPPAQRAGRFGMLGAAFGLGFIVGPAVGGALGAISPRLPFWVAGGLSLANAMYGLVVLPESLPVEKRSPFSWARANPLGSLALLREHPMLLGLAGACALHFLAHEVLPSAFVLYTDYRYGWNARDVGFALAAIGICTTIVSAAGVGPIVKRFGERRAAAIGLLFGMAFFTAAGTATTGLLFAMALPIEAPWGLAGPSLQGLMSRHIGPDGQGALQGALGSVRGITGMIGPVLFTQLFAGAISPTMVVPLPGAPWWLAASLLGASLLVAWRVTRPAAEGAVADVG